MTAPVTRCVPAPKRLLAFFLEGKNLMLDKQNGRDGIPQLAEATGVATAPAPATSLLVIEDDENISAALEEYFSRAGYSVTTAADGLAGVDAAIKTRPDVVVLDLMLDRKSTRLNSSHLVISYAVFCLKKKNNTRCESL